MTSGPETLPDGHDAAMSDSSASPTGDAPNPTADTTGEPIADTVERVFFELRKVIVGQSRLLERLLVGLLSRGHCLIESVPGLAKKLAAETLADVPLPETWSDAPIVEK